MIYFVTRVLFIITLIWCNTGFLSQIELPDSNKNYTNTDIDDKMFWKIELQPTQDVISMEANWPEKLLQIITENLITILNQSAQTYHKAQITTDNRNTQVNSILQNTYNGFFGDSFLSNSVPSPH